MSVVIMWLHSYAIIVYNNFEMLPSADIKWMRQLYYGSGNYISSNTVYHNLTPYLSYATYAFYTSAISVSKCSVNDL